MKTLPRVTVAALLVVALVSGAPAQVKIQPKKIEIQPVPLQPGGPGAFALNPLAFLQDKGVQKDLKLSDEQIKKIDEQAARQADLVKDPTKLKELTEGTAKFIDETLTKNQVTRLEQLKLQARGPSAFFDPMIMKELSITDEQRLTITKTIGDTFIKHMREFVNPKEKPQEYVKQVAEASRAAMEDAVKQLTKEQQAKWRTMTGTPFDGTLPAITQPTIRPGIQRLPGGQTFPPEFWEGRR